MADDRKGVRAGVYDRESKGKESSIEDQNRENLAACEENGWSVAVRYRDKVGASRRSTKVRDGWPKVIVDVAAGRIDVLVVWEVARADRVMDTWVPFVSACAQTGVLFHITSLEMTYDPRKAAHRKALLDMGSSAEAETGQLSERSQKGIRGAVLAGKPHGRSASGFTRRYGPLVDGKRTFTEEPDDYAPVVKEVIERIARADPIVRIVEDLHARGIWTPAAAARVRDRTNTWGPVCERGCDHGSCRDIRGRWARNSVRQLATRPTYAGMRGHNGATHPGNWKPIVPESVWLNAQAVLADPARRTTQPGRFKWLLSYLAKSSPCGGWLNARPGKDGKRSKYRCVTDGCVAVGVAELDTLITDLVLARLARPDARAQFVPDDTEAEEARAEVARVRIELDDLARQLELGPDHGGISATLAARAEPGIRSRLVDAERRVAATATRNGPLLALLGDEEMTEQELRPRWGRLSVAARRDVVQALTERIEVGQAESFVTRWTTDEERVQFAAERTAVTWKGQGHMV